METAINWLKKGKASGLDEIPNEFIKSLEGEAMRTLLEIFNHILRSDEIPEAWKQTRIRLLHKGKGKKFENLNSFRPIAVANSLYKLYMKMLKDRLNTFLEEEVIIGEMQNGFRQGRQIGDNPFTVTIVIEIARKKNRS